MDQETAFGTDASKSRAIETRESQLWWLAVVLIFLLAVAVCLVDLTNASGKWWVSPQIEFALNTTLMREALVLATLVICAYFRDTARRLRRQNHELIGSLEDRGLQLEKQNHDISMLKDLSEQLISIADLKSALNLVLNMAVELIDADTASIMLREKDSDTLKILAAHGLPASAMESPGVKMGEAIAGMVAQDGRAVILNSDELNGEVARRALRGKAIVSSLLVPIRVGDDVRGVVSVAKRRGSSCFTEKDLGALSALTNEASLAIQKIELLNDLKHQVEKLAATVAELRQTQAELMQSAKLASIGQLAGGVAHEINNPLQVIQGRAELLIEDETDENKLRGLHTVLDHTLRIAAIVSNLLSFSRQNADAEFREVDVNDVVKRTLDLLEPQMVPNNIEIVRNLGDELDPISGNAGQLQQVFTNIAMNACQAMRCQGSGALTVRTKSCGGRNEIEFVDTGPGIPSVLVDRIFEPFFTTKADGEGTGLGLSIAYGIVQSHKGSLRVSSKPGKGARFTISLPATGCGELEGQTPTQRRANRHKPMKLAS